MVQSIQTRALRLALIGASCLTGLVAAPAFAQQAAPAASASDTVEEVVVTGFRKSLADATNAKRDSIAFTDSVFAEDIGKFPDLNIAESLNRIPGIQLTREINGDGLNIAVRGLGTNFTKILLNGSQIAVASSGRTDAQNQNREVDLNLFPTELFTRLDVSKTPMASQVEGGVAGVVNMRNARPLDRAGRHFTYSLQGGYQESAGKWSPRGAILASDSWDTSAGEFGLLIGYAGVRTKTRTDGFETIGWTNANLTYAQCGTTPPVTTPPTLPTAASPACNSAIGGNGFKFADTVPATAGNGLIAGTPVTAAYLESLNPGTTAQQLGDGLLPRLGRQSYSEGKRNRDSVLISGEWRPNDSLAFYSDLLLGKTHNNFNRLDMDWIVRNSGGMIPLNVKVDSNNVVTKGTFANSQFFLEARPYDEKVDFYNFNPGGSWQINPWLLLDGQFNLSRSVFFREAPTILVNSPAGLTVDFDNTGGDMPLIKTTANLNDPNLGWTFAGGRLNIQNEKRVTANKGTHWNLKIGEDNENYIKVGVAYDDITRSIQALDNSTAWQTFTCGGGLVNGVAPTPTPGCNGQAGSAITQAQLASYLRPGPGFITVDYDSFKAASQFDRFNDTAPAVSSAATAASSGFIEEETTGAYIEANAVTQILDRDLAFNFGGRYVTTDQTIRGPQTVNGVTTTLERQTRYDAFLPAFNAVYKVQGQRQPAHGGLADPHPRQPQRHAAGHDLQRSVGPERQPGQPGAQPLHLEQLRRGRRVVHRRRGLCRRGSVPEGDQRLHRPRHQHHPVQPTGRGLRQPDHPAAGGHRPARRPERRDGHRHPAGQRRRHPDHPRLRTELGPAAGLPDPGHRLHGQLHPHQPERQRQRRPGRGGRRLALHL
jgi:TonB-dependent receptor